MKTSLKATLIAAAIAALPLGASAAGLGPINVYSGLGQPLRAEIELKATPQELQSLTARIASPEAFRQANVPYASAITGLKLSVDARGTRPVVRISSDRPVNEPFVDLLLELNWASGRLIREYTFLLDPVDVAAPAPLGAQVAVPATAPVAARQAAAPTPAAEAASDSYRVQRGDTLRAVAETHRPSGATLEQMLVALFRENPAAFDGGNINRLRAGAILRIPEEGVVQAVAPVQARREVLAQAADFEAYRARLAGAVAARPAAADEPGSRTAAGAIVPRVDESARPGDSGDRVKVSGASSAPGDATTHDAARLARLQALEEELVAREKALDEANSRVAELEKSILEFQQLLELRNKSLAQMQGQASSAAANPDVTPPQPQAAEPVAEPPLAPVATPKAPAPAKAPVQPAPAPSFLQTLLDDPTLLAGGGAALALLLGLAGYKVRQRRKEDEEALARDALGPVSEMPENANSVFGQSGGQNVDTNSSVIQTDFSQSGLSAIDADEGVDPVAEADVYMAYGRDAQAEEILLDALKVDASRAAIYLKLLEIYAQRKSLQQFETVATDLYSRTGGEGPDWVKAAELGRALDPDNPLYNPGSAAAKMHSPVTEQPLGNGKADAGIAKATFATAAAAAATAPTFEAQADEEASATLSALDFTTSIPSGTTAAFAQTAFESSDELTASDVLGEIALTGSDESSDDAGLSLATAADGSDAVAVSEIDSGALDFDLDFEATPGELSLPEQPAAPAVAATPAVDEKELVFDLDMDVDASPVQAAAPTAAIGDEELSFALDADEGERVIAVEPATFDIDATMVLAPVSGQAGEGGGDVALDLEKTTFDSSLLDFDFDLEAEAASAEKVSSQVAPATAPVLDLSSIDLELPDVEEVLEAPESSVSVPFDLEPATEAPSLGDEDAGHASERPISAESAQEIDTKLELARAYEEMGDKEGASELLEEVLRDGSPEQRAEATRLKERLA